MQVMLWGTRGSIPTPSKGQTTYGGNTPCVAVRTSDRRQLILDGGMGLHWLGKDLLQAGFSSGTGRAYILLTHTHWDHIQGIPFCYPMLISGNRFFIYGCGDPSTSMVDLLKQQMATTYCPVPNFFEDHIGATVQVEDIDPGQFTIGETRILARQVNHVPGAVCLGYRLENGTSSLAYLPDVEYLEEEHRQQALELAQGVDLLIHNAHFTTEEYKNHRGQGYATDADALDIATRAGVGRLLLFHHHPERDDDAIERMAATYADGDIPVEAARQGAQYILGT